MKKTSIDLGLIFRAKVRSIIEKLRYAENWFFFRVFDFLPVQNNKIVFISNGGMNISQQLKDIYDNIICLDLKDIDIVWVLNDNINAVAHKNTRFIKYGGIRFVFELVTAKIWLSNGREQAYFKKRKNQYYIMTWHGAAPLKYIEKDAESMLPEYYIKCAINDSNNTDLMIAESEHMYRIMSRSFWYEGKILKESFFNKSLNDYEKNVKKIKDKFNLRFDSKIILYVPTFRQYENSKYFDIEYEHVLDELDIRLGETYAFIVRLHDNNARKTNEIKYNDHIKNGTYYESIDELISAADYIISDYSGCLIKGYRLYKKVIIFAKDYDEYIAKEREMYFDLRKLPSPVATTSDELIRCIVDYNKENYIDGMKKLNEYIGYFGGDAATTIAGIIKDKIEG